MLMQAGRRWLIGLFLFLLIPIVAEAATPEEARQQLARDNIPFTQEHFELAIWNDSEIVVALFLDAGMDPSAREANSGWPVLMRAAWRGRAEIVNVLLRRGANPNGRSPSGTTALMSTSSPTIAQALIDAGAVVDQKDGERATALMYAAQSGHLAVVSVLLDYGADIKAKGSIEKNEDSTALQYAAERGHADIVKELLQRGADPNVRNADGVSPLMRAAYSADVPTVTALLDAGGDPNMLSANGQTTVWDRAIFSQRGGVGVIQLLIQRKANINLMNKDGHTPLDFAKLKGDAEITNLLLANGARPGRPF
jgi:uncharacterized protein